MNLYLKIILKIILASALMLIPFVNIFLLIYPLFTFKKWRAEYSIQLNSINNIILGVVGICSAITIFSVYPDMISFPNGMWYLPLLAPVIYIYGIRIYGYFGLFKSSEEDMNFLYNRIVTILGIITAVFFGFLVILFLLK
tara:strand:+ start:537 stop:956 length:420 start_codon:yes stop_codon:yes gene_type:complete